jgi:hypothetical protein
LNLNTLIEEREIRKIALEEVRRGMKIYFPQPTVYAIANAAASKMVDARSISTGGYSAFTTVDTTPYVQTVDLTLTDCVGQITYYMSVGIPDGSEVAFYCGVAGFKVVGGVSTVEATGDIIAYAPGGVLTGSLISISGNADGDLEIEFIGIAATEIQGRFTWSYEAVELVDIEE